MLEEVEMVEKVEEVEGVEMVECFFSFYPFSLVPCSLNSGRGGDSRFLKWGGKTRSKIRLWRDRKHNETKAIVCFGEPPLAGQLFSRKRITRPNLSVAASLP